MCYIAHCDHQSTKTADEIEVVEDGKKVSCLALSQRYGSIVALGYVDSSISIYSIGNPEPLMLLQGPSDAGAVSTLSFDVLEEVLVATFGGGLVCIWDLDSEVLMRKWKAKERVMAAKVHPFAGLVALLFSASQIELWHIQHKTLVQTYSLGDKYKALSTLDFSPDGQHLACGATDSTGKPCVAVISLESGSVVHSLRDSSDTTGSITSLKFHPKEPILATTSSSGKVAMFDFSKFEPIAFPTPPSAVSQLCWSQDGDCLTALGSKNVSIWKTASISEAKILETLAIEPTDSFAQLSFGFESFAILTTCVDRMLVVSYYQLQTLGLFGSDASKSQIDSKIDKTSEVTLGEEETSSPPSNGSNSVITSEDEAALSKLAQSKLLYTLKNRLDHLKTLRTTLAAKPSQSVLQTVLKQPSATRPELLGELIAGRIVELSLNITPATIGGPNGLSNATSEDLATFVSLLKQHLRHMSETHQLASLAYVLQLVRDLSTICPEKFEPLLEEISRLSTEATSVPVSEKANEILEEHFRGAI